MSCAMHCLRVICSNVKVIAKHKLRCACVFHHKHDTEKSDWPDIQDVNDPRFSHFYTKGISTNQ